MKLSPTPPVTNEVNVEKDISQTLSVLRKANKLRVARNTICTDVVLLEAILHVHASRFIEIYAPSLHDAHDLLLACIIQSLS